MSFARRVGALALAAACAASSPAAAARESVVVGLRAAVAPQAERGASGTAARAARRAAAAGAEASLLSRLDTARRSGDAARVHAFWLGPWIAADVSPELRREIAARGDVAWVRDNAVVARLAPAARTPRAAVRSAPRAAPLDDRQAPQWFPRTVAGVDAAAAVYGVDGAGVRICVLDTGVDASHPDLGPRMVTRDPSDPTFPGGWGEFDQNGALVPGSVPYDSEGHGTHVTGIAVAGSASGWQIGVAPGAAFMHGLVLPGGSGRLAQILGGIEWAADPDADPATDDGASVVTMSFGIVDTVGALADAVRGLLDLGIVPVGAIGNSPAALSAPGTVPDAIGVGATDSADAVAPFSARGATTWNHGSYVGTLLKPDVVAPGVDIFSTVPYGTWEWNRYGEAWSGTSQAAPFTAGIAALMREANPALAADSVRTLLRRTAHDVGAPGADTASGAGRVDAYAAVTAAYAGRPWLAGTVQDAVTGAPLAHALLTLRPDGPGSWSQSLAADSLGRFSVRPPDAAVVLTVAAFAHDTLTQALSLPLDVVTPLDPALAPRPVVRVAGRLFDLRSRAGVAGDVQAVFGGFVAAREPSDADGSFTLDLPLGAVLLQAVPPAPYDTTRIAIDVTTATGETPLLLGLDRRELLLVNASDEPDDGPLYRASLDAAGRRYAVAPGRPDAATMRTYGKVLWFTGDATYNTLSADDQSAVTDFLARGGRLLLAGKGVAKELELTSFLPDVLHVRHGADPTAATAAVGAAGDPAFTGFHARIVPVPGGAAERPSALVPLSPAHGAVSYNDSSVAGATADLGPAAGEARLVFLGFGLEEMPDDPDRTALLTRALDWLEPAPSIALTPLGDTDDDASPYAVAADVRVSVTALDTTAVRLIYAIGDGAPVTVPLTRSGETSVFTGAIPAQPLGSTVRYRVEAADAAGGIGHAPDSLDAAGEPAFYSFRVLLDSQPPVITHVPLEQTNDVAGPYAIQATVTDDRAVAGVTLRYRWTGGAWADVAMLPDVPGGSLFSATVAGPARIGDTLSYAIIATDASRSANTATAPAAGVFTLRIVGAYQWDFEASGGGFAANDWQWGVPTAARDGRPVGAHSGGRVWATRLTGGYNGPATGTLDLPSIVLRSDAAVATLHFFQAYEFDGEPPILVDGGLVRLSTDGGVTWTALTPADGYDGVISASTPGVGGQAGFGGSALSWRETSIALTPWLGRAVRIRFQEGGHFGAVGLGWFIDDVSVVWGARDSVPPVLARLSRPRSTPDATGPYAIDAVAGDGETSVSDAVVRYSTDGGASFFETPLAAHGPPSVRALIPGQPAGTRVRWYAEVSDAASPPNTRRVPDGDSTFAFAVFPAAPVLVLRSSDAPVAAAADSLAAALGDTADVWDLRTFAHPTAALLDRYSVFVLDGDLGPDAATRAALDSVLAGRPRAPRLLVAARSPAPDANAASWLSDWTGARVVSLTSAPETVCLTGTALSTTLQSRHAHVTSFSESEPLIGRCPAASESLVALRRTGTDPSAVAGASLADLPAPLRASFLGHMLPLLRFGEGGARFDIVAPSNTEDASGPYPVRLYAAAPSGIDTASLSLAVTLNGVAGPSVPFTAGPGVDEYTAWIPGQPVGTTIACAASGRTGAGEPLSSPSVGSFSVVADVSPPVLTGITATSLPGPQQIDVSLDDGFGGTGVASASLTYSLVPPGGPAPPEQTVAMVRDRLDPSRFSAALPTAGAGTRLRFRVMATDRARSSNVLVAPGPDRWFTSGVLPSAPVLLLGSGALDAVSAMSALADSGVAVDAWDGAAPLPVALTQYGAVVGLGAPLGTFAADAAVESLATIVAFGVDFQQAPADSVVARDVFGARPSRVAPAAGSGAVRGLPGEPDAVWQGLAPFTALVPDASAAAAEVEGRFEDTNAGAVVVNAPGRGHATALVGASPPGFASGFAHVIAQTLRSLGARAAVFTPVDRLAFLPLRPQPASPPVAFRLAVPGDAGTAPQVRLRIHDAAGRLVRTVLDGPAPAGVSAASWDGRDALGRSVAPGVYFARLRSGDYTATTRVVLVRP